MSDDTWSEDCRQKKTRLRRGAQGKQKRDRLSQLRLIVPANFLAVLLGMNRLRKLMDREKPGQQHTVFFRFMARRPALAT